jgi:hypothetical protein
MDQGDKCSLIIQKPHPEDFLFVPGGSICDWIVYDKGEVAFVTIGRAWYQRQERQGNNFVSMGAATNPSIILTIPDLEDLCSLTVATHLHKRPVYDYKDILAELLGINPSEYTYLSTNHPSFPELQQYDEHVDWIVFQGTCPEFLLKGDLVTGYDWYRRILPTATYQCINPLTQNNPETTTTGMIDMSYNHLTRISHHNAMEYDTFCTIETIKARRQQKEFTAQIEKLKSENLERGIMLAQMYAVGCMPRAPTKVIQKSRDGIGKCM